MSNALDNQIILGSLATPLYTFDNASISRVGGTFAVDVVGNQMSVDTVKAELRYDKDQPAVYILGGGTRLYVTRDGKLYILKNALGDLRLLPYGTPIWWRNNGNLICAGFVRNVERIGRYRFRVNIFSGLGLLQNIYHPGGVYTGQTFAEVAADIIGDTFEYTVASAIADLPVYGWLPYDTRRNNLHQLTFALGVALRRDEAGNPAFVFLTASSPRQIAESRVAFGGSVDYESPATRADITEHAFYAEETDETITLFDNTDGGAPAANTTVIFSEAPVHDLTASGSLQIIEQHVNYAVVTGTGTLTGKLYTHTRRIVQRSAENPTGAENVKRVEDMTLVSIANSQNVAKRVLAYYSSAKTVRAQIAMDGERCGDLLSMLDPYYDQMQAFLQEASVNASTNLLANCVLIEGYTPTGQGNNYSGNVLLTGSGTYTVPDGVTKITAVLIGGGTGGSAGSAGTEAVRPTVTKSTSGTGTVTYTVGVPAASAGPSEGGAPGAPGEGGKVYVVELEVTPGQQIIFSCGAGGAGEIFGGAAAQEGGDTTFGINSSANGSRSDAGYINPISGTVYATPGADGVAGGPGIGYGQNESGAYAETEAVPVTFNGITTYPGSRGSSFQSSRGSSNSDYGSFICVAGGGFGGGAAAGANGADGANGSGTFNNSPVTQATSYPGKGGDGATALPPPKEATPGRGGAGGNGGGGGGQWGWPAYVQNIVGPNATKYSRDSGVSFGGMSPSAATMPRPGNGSDGGEGADGAILIYY